MRNSSGWTQSYHDCVLVYGSETGGTGPTPGTTVAPTPVTTPEPSVAGTAAPTPIVTPAPTGSGTLGDVNGSGAVDIVGALLVAQYDVVLNPVNFNTAVADVNKDGTIDIVDALRIAQFYVGLITGF